MVCLYMLVDLFPFAAFNIFSFVLYLEWLSCVVGTFCFGPVYLVFHRSHVLIGTPFFGLGKSSSMILLKIFCVSLTWVSCPSPNPPIYRFLFFHSSQISWMFCTWIFLGLTFYFIHFPLLVFIAWVSLFRVLVGLPSEVSVWLSKIFMSSFISVGIFFSDSVSSFMSHTVFITSFHCSLRFHRHHWGLLVSFYTFRTYS